MLKRRAKGAKPIHEVEEEEKPTNVVDLMDALKNSLGGRRSSRKGADTGKGGEVVAFRGRSRPARKTAAKPRKRAKRR